jgi:hypothetical protein
MRPEFESLPPGLPYLLTPRPVNNPSLRDTLTLYADCMPYTVPRPLLQPSRADPG